MRDVVEAITGEYVRYQKMAEGCFAQLSEAELSQDPDAVGNSVATLAWHVSGNLKSRFTDFLSADGEKPWRQREEEFASRTVTREELMAKWDEGWSVLRSQLGELEDADLGRKVIIRGQSLSVVEALQRSLAHCAFHVGQIVFLGKRLRGAEWQYLSIAPGGTAAYNQNPTRERAPKPGDA